MRRLFCLTCVGLSFFVLAPASPAQAAGKRVYCPAIYLPVCGWKQGRWQTFSNRCVAAGEGARRIRFGPCDKRGR